MLGGDGSVSPLKLPSEPEGTTNPARPSKRLSMRLRFLAGVLSASLAVTATPASAFFGALFGGELSERPPARHHCDQHERAAALPNARQRPSATLRHRGRPRRVYLERRDHDQLQA
jgi:hypothetical protein